MVKKKTGKKKGRSFDFTGVETGGKAVPNGTYLAEIADVEEKTGSDSGEPYWLVKWKILEGPGKGATVYDNVSHQPQALWKMRGLLESIGYDVPDGALEVDEADLVGEQCQVEITNEKWNGKDKPRVSGYANAEGGPEKDDDDAEKDDDDQDDDDKKDKDDDDQDDDEDEKPKGGKKKTTASAGKSKVKVGSKVKFKDEDDNVIKGVVTSIDGDDAEIEDKSGESWEVDVSELEVVG